MPQNATLQLVQGPLISICALYDLIQGILKGSSAHEDQLQVAQGSWIARCKLHNRLQCILNESYLAQGCSYNVAVTRSQISRLSRNTAQCLQYKELVIPACLQESTIQGTHDSAWSLYQYPHKWDNQYPHKVIQGSFVQGFVQGQA